MAAGSVDPSSSPSPSPYPIAPPRRRKARRPSLLSCALLLVDAAAPASSFRTGRAPTTLAFRGARPPPGPRRWARYEGSGCASRKSSPLVVNSVSNSPSSLGSDVNSNIEELESLRRTRRSSSSSPDSQRERTAPAPGYSPAEGTRRPLAPNGHHSSTKPKSSVKSILREPAGELTPSELNSLCNSIRHTRKGMSFQNLGTLERVLSELDRSRHSAGKANLLKPIHVFPMLAALSNDVRALKRKGTRADKKRAGHKRSANHKIGEGDVRRLTNVVDLLRRLDRGGTLRPGCYTEDVPSFAAMIAAEASRWEDSAVDAALSFYHMAEEEEGEWGGNDGERDPRLVGAVLDALARAGRAEEAQALLGRASGADIPYLDSNVCAEGAAPVAASTRRLDPSRAGACYDALLRAWSKKASLSARAESDDARKTRRDESGGARSRETSSAESSLAQARHVVLNHMPLLPGPAITNRTCAAVLGGYSSAGMGAKSERMLMELEALHLSPLYSSNSVEPSASPSSLDVACYNTVLHAYGQSEDSDAVVRAERLFSAMRKRTPLNVAVEDFAVDVVEAGKAPAPSSPSFSIVPPAPDLISFSSMLNCLGRHGAVPRAEALLEGMHGGDLAPNAACYHAVLRALGASDDADAPGRALVWLERGRRSLARPSRILHVAALQCMSRHGRGEEAEAVLDGFREAFPDGRGGGPDPYSHSLVLRAWERMRARADWADAADRARAFFDEMNAPDVGACNTLLNCYARAGEADKAERLLADLEGGRSINVRPNSKSYSMVIKALANSDADDAVDRARRILHRLGYPEDVKSAPPPSGTVPFDVTMDNLNSMLKLLAKRGMATEAEALLNEIDELIVEGTISRTGPDIQSYEAVLEALGRCGDADAPSRAEALVTRLEVLDEMGGDCRPSLMCYNALLNCYANAGMAGKAERLLERLSDPDSYSYGSTIKAIANSGKSQLVAVSRAESLANTFGTDNEIIFTHRMKLLSKFGMGKEAEQLLRQMEEGHLRPDVIHYTAAINAWAKSSDDDATRRAEALFKTMEGNSGLHLDRAAYHGLLLNYSTRGNSKEARRLLQRMLDSPDVTPNRNSFTMVIDSHARSRQSKIAGQKAEELLDEMRELHAAGNHEVEPDKVTYASVIRCKQISKEGKIHEMTNFEKIQLMRELQIESWPFARND